jgi:DNA-binding transcriptional LysR family regulator
MSESQDVPTGQLLVTTTVGIGSTWLSSRIHEFLLLYPDITIEIKLNDAELDLAMREADVAIRLHRPNQSEMIQRKLFTVHHHIWASNEYVKKYGLPKAVEDLDKHRIITMGQMPSYLDSVNWLEVAGRREGDPRPPVLRVNNAYGLRRAAQAGIGIASLADYLVAPDMGLIKIDIPIEAPEWDTYFVYPEELKETKRVTVFRDFIVSKAREWSF